MISIDEAKGELDSILLTLKEEEKKVVKEHTDGMFTNYTEDNIEAMCLNVVDQMQESKLKNNPVLLDLCFYFLYVLEMDESLRGLLIKLTALGEMAEELQKPSE